jgi:hypothetical protein
VNTYLPSHKKDPVTMRVFGGRTHLLLLSAVFAVNADDLIYPDDHWNYSNRLTEENSECSVDGTGCNEHSLKFLEKWKDKHPQDIHNELDRLMSLMEGDTNHELKDWVKERRDNLKQIADDHDEIQTEL